MADLNHEALKGTADNADNLLPALSDYLNNMSTFAEHNLNALKTESWKDFKGYGISEDMHIDGDVCMISNLYEAYLLCDRERSQFFLNALAYSVEMHLWFESVTEDNTSMDDFYNYIIMDVGEMMTGNFSQIKRFLEDIREDDEFMDDDDELFEDVEEKLDGFSKKIIKLEEEYDTKSKEQCMSGSFSRKSR